MSLADTIADAWDEDLAALAIDGFSAPQTLTIAHILRREHKAFSDLTTADVIIANLKLDAIQALNDLLTVPDDDRGAIAAARARIAAFVETKALVRRFADAEREILDTMKEKDREFLEEEFANLTGGRG